MTHWNDTIVAIATPRGIGAVAIIRISGKNALSIIDVLFHKKNLQSITNRQIAVGILTNVNKQPIDEVLLIICRAPKSYTGEDLVEIQCHGSRYIQETILQTIIQQGARIANPGEFTQRAFLNGKLDLIQAEAVADIIQAETAASHQAALQHLRGGFSKDIQLLREQLLKISSLMELELDFSEEDLEFADRQELYNIVHDLQTKTTALLASFKMGNAIKNGVRLAIIGPPNAGKSTLLNTLLNEDRAIVSPIPGTTRDTIEEVLNIQGVLFRLIDTAGMRETATDAIELLGIAKSKQIMHTADLIVFVYDTTHTTQQELILIEKSLNDKTYLLVGNKIDQLAQPIPPISKKNLFISAQKKHHIEELKQCIFETTVQKLPNTEDALVTNIRHFEALQKLSTSLNLVQQGLAQQQTTDLLTIDIKACLEYIGTIAGVITHDEQLSYIFSKFCIGK
ncbi:MAG: tRNA uridine-5-carboxymethylaminomethyl(34) synthesis GTPase MnmE [Phycisphaerales bacterium]|nr:tRNA uridine-5-carboxymethylaminomethyl(34) synthesis GTPase MnmE [Phycisphaerales bacterium]